MTPQPLQRKRTKGFRYPEGAKVLTVTRGTIYGNPYRVIDRTRVSGDWMVTFYGRDWWSCSSREEGLETAIKLFRGRMNEIQESSPAVYAGMMRDILVHDYIACFCEIGQPCHRDVLIKLAAEWRE